jgi:D-glycerate 3-kinase
VRKNALDPRPALLKLCVMTELADALLPLLKAELSEGTAPRLVFISGAQGIGKSTALRSVLEALGPGVIGLGIDDFYLPKAERAQLAAEVHSLVATRGPPGTHDIPLLQKTLSALQTARPSEEIALPRFSKRDDERAEPVVLKLEDRPSLIILEGWLMGVAPDPSAPLDAPRNSIEAEDPSGAWRQYQEEQIGGPYARLWDMADSFIHLDAPGFQTVLDWRLQQEAETLGKAPGTLTEAETEWVERFILHYQRLTERLLSGHRWPGNVIKVRRDRTVASANEVRGKTL